MLQQDMHPGRERLYMQQLLDTFTSVSKTKNLPVKDRQEGDHEQVGDPWNGCHDEHDVRPSHFIHDLDEYHLYGEKKYNIISMVKKNLISSLW